MTISPLEVGLLVSLLCSLIALVIAIKGLSVARQQQVQTEKILARLSSEIALATTGAVNMGQRLIAIEKRLYAEPVIAPAAPKSAETDDEEFEPYSQAAELFKAGLGCDEVARRCGLSRAEVSLIQMMQLNTSGVK